MKRIFQIFLISVSILLPGCVTEFVPKTTADSEMLVVEGLVTDRPEVYTIKLSRPQHLGLQNVPRPVQGSVVSVSDDSGQTFQFTETNPGTYVSDPSSFQGKLGHFYTLHISTDVNSDNVKYESYPMELKPVPQIDSLYYEKVNLVEETPNTQLQQGCNIFLDTWDPSNNCKYFRWEYSETWEIHIPFPVPNSVCWISSSSPSINIKNTNVLAEDKIVRYPVSQVSNSSDRLSVNYSILVNQYSLSEDEYRYWEKSLNVSQQVGGLYDIIPSSVSSNIYRLDNPNEQVLGYFSVSGCSSKRLFVKDHFTGLFSPYTNDICISDTIYGSPSSPIAHLGTSVWVIINHPLPPPSYRVLTRIKDCYDCTLRGTNIMPDFWK